MRNVRIALFAFASIAMMTGCAAARDEERGRWLSSGGRCHRSIASAIVRQDDDITSCANDWFSSEGTAPRIGLRLHLVASREGQVTKAEWSNSSAPTPPRVAECIVNVARKMDVGRSEEEVRECTTSFAFDFSEMRGGK